MADAPHLAQNLRNYIAGFSPNMREVLEKLVSRAGADAYIQAARRGPLSPLEVLAPAGVAVDGAGLLESGP